jgi:hypothetical protein
MTEPTHDPRPGAVALLVRSGERTLLEYSFATTREVAEMVAFLRDFLPAAQFVIQPVRH